MSAPAPFLQVDQRLLTFEIGGSVYALPIACVVEVSDVDALSSIPTVPFGTAGMMNHHGDALPLVGPSCTGERQGAQQGQGEQRRGWGACAASAGDSCRHCAAPWKALREDAGMVLPTRAT